MKINIETRFNPGQKVFVLRKGNVYRTIIYSICVDAWESNYVIFYNLKGIEMPVNQSECYETLELLTISKNIKKKELEVEELS